MPFEFTIPLAQRIIFFACRNEPDAMKLTMISSIFRETCLDYNTFFLALDKVTASHRRLRLSYFFEHLCVNGCFAHAENLLKNIAHDDADPKEVKSFLFPQQGQFKGFITALYRVDVPMVKLLLDAAEKFDLLESAFYCQTSTSDSAEDSHSSEWFGRYRTTPLQAFICGTSKTQELHVNDIAMLNLCLSKMEKNRYVFKTLTTCEAASPLSENGSGPNYVLNLLAWTRFPHSKRFLTLYKHLISFLYHKDGGVYLKEILTNGDSCTQQLLHLAAEKSAAVCHIILSYARKVGGDEFVLELLEATNVDGRTPLMLAAHQGEGGANTVKMLVGNLASRADFSRHLHHIRDTYKNRSSCFDILRNNSWLVKDIVPAIGTDPGSECLFYDECKMQYQKWYMSVADRSN